MIQFYNVQQRSYEWFDLRAGKITASEAGSWLTKDDKRSLETREKMICKKIAEARGYESPPVFENWYMKRGTELEKAAVESFSKETGFAVEEMGFISDDELSAGCSPDGIIKGLPEGFEGKAPAPETHIRYLLRPQLLEASYYWQVHFSLAITDFELWHLQSYCPNLPSVRCRVTRNEDTEALKDGILKFSQLLEESKAKILSSVLT